MPKLFDRLMFKVIIFEAKVLYIFLLDKSIEGKVSIFQSVFIKSEHTLFNAPCFKITVIMFIQAILKTFCGVVNLKSTRFEKKLGSFTILWN